MSVFNVCGYVCLRVRINLYSKQIFALNIHMVMLVSPNPLFWFLAYVLEHAQRSSLLGIAIRGMRQTVV